MWCRKLGEYICPNCFASISFDVTHKCLICQFHSIGGFTHPKCQTKYSIDGVSSAVRYKGVIKKLLYQFKYKPYLTDLQNTLGELLEESLSQNEQFMDYIKSRPLVVPIPLFKNKLHKRGYNQAQILGRELAKRFGLKTENVLIRTKPTKPQYGLSKEERKENMKNAFSINPSPLILSQGERKNTEAVILIDDVLTTGSTLWEAARILKHHGISKVWGVTFAQD